MHAFMCNRHLRGKFFNEMQRKIVEKYPNNILEDLKSQRKGTKGPLVSKLLFLNVANSLLK